MKLRILLAALIIAAGSVRAGIVAIGEGPKELYQVSTERVTLITIDPELQPGDQYEVDIVSPEGGTFTISAFQITAEGSAWTQREYWRTKWTLDAGATHELLVRNKAGNDPDYLISAVAFEPLGVYADGPRAWEVLNDPRFADREAQIYVSGATSFSGHGDFGWNDIPENTIPEPSSALLLLIGLSILGRRTK